MRFDECSIMRVQTLSSNKNHMPEVSRFLGIVISMYAETPARHHEPHFHAYYGEHAAVFSIASGQLLAGSLPTSQERIIEAWRRARLAELHENWERLQARQRVDKIPPL
jgi:hypothetical protein